MLRPLELGITGIRPAMANAGYQDLKVQQALREKRKQGTRVTVADCPTEAYGASRRILMLRGSV